MNLFSFTSLSVVICCLTMTIFISRIAKTKTHKLWAFFNLSVASWALGTFFASISQSPQHAEMSWRWAYGTGAIVPAMFYHFIYSFCELKKEKILSVVYIFGFLLIPTGLLAPNYVNELTYVFDSFYYNKATILLSILIIYLLIVVCVSFIELLVYLKLTKGNKRLQTLYMLWGFGIGWSGGIITFLSSYDILIYPAWNFLASIYIIIMTYAIFRYQILDIRVAITRLGVSLLVYTLVLGIPFGMAMWGQIWLTGILGEQWFWVPMLTLLAFATAGPYIYHFLQRKAEERFFQEEQRIQNLLLQASQGMNMIHDLQKLVNLIRETVKNTLGVDHAEVHLLDQETRSDDRLIEALKEKQGVLVYEEIKMQADMEEKDINSFVQHVAAKMKELHAGAIAPIMVDKNLRGFLVLGERQTKDMYSKGLLNALTVLCNQAALAIENCNYVEEAINREAKEQRERMASLDHMASSMAHEIDNPVHIIMQSVGFLKHCVSQDANISLPEKTKSYFIDSLNRSQAASQRISAMIKAILDYSRMGTGQLKPVHMTDVVQDFFCLMEPQLKEEKVKFTKEIAKALPPVLGDKVQLEEILVNFVQNAMHAVKRNEDKQIILKIFQTESDAVRIECTDNGYGIPKALIKDIFLSSTTTKGSSEGTGLGLFRVRKIVDLHQGRVWAESEGEGKGARFIVELPVYGNNKK